MRWYVQVARVHTERRLPKAVRTREALEAILAHMHMHVETAPPWRTTGMVIHVVPDDEEG